MDEPQRSGWWQERRTTSAALGVSLLVAAVILIHQLGRPSGVLGLDEYDDGVYFGSSLRVLQGRLPYRSFVFPHPPGMTLVLLPFAIIGRIGSTRIAFGLVRIFTALVWLASVWLIGRILRHRGLLAALAGSLSFAVFPIAVTANKSSMLEPYFVFFVLLAVALMFDSGRLMEGRRLWWGGAALGFAAVIKALLAPMLLVLVLVLFVKHRHDRARWRSALTGYAVGAIAPCLPFFLAAPGSFVRQVFLRQLQRGVSSGATSLGNRFVFTGGFRIYPTLRGAAGWSTLIVLLVLGAIGISQLAARSRFESDWFIVGGLVVALVSVLVPKDYFTHYSYYTAALLALAGGAAVGRIGGLVIESPHRSMAVREIVAAVLVTTVVSAGFVGAVRGWRVLEAHPGLQTSGDPGGDIARLIPSGSCVVTDVVALAVISDRFYAGSSCPAVVDSYFTWVDYDPSRPPPAKADNVPELSRQWQRWFERADYVVLSRDAFRIPWSPELRALLNTRFVLVAKLPEMVFAKQA